MNKLLDFARSVLSSECYVAVIKLQEEIRKLRVDPSLFTVVVGVIPREQGQEFDVGTMSFARDEGVYVVSGDSYDVTDTRVHSALSEERLIGIIENEVMNVSECVDTTLLRLQEALDELKKQAAEKEGAN